MSELDDESVNLVVTSPPYWNLKDYDTKNQIGISNESYDDYLNDLYEVFQECIRVLVPDGKICINIMPIFLSGDQSQFDRRITKTVLSDFERFFESTGKMFFLSLFIWDKTESTNFCSFGSYPYPPNLFSTFPYEWIMVFSKGGKRPKVSKERKEASRISKEKWQKWCVDSIWKFAPASSEKENHPAPFPEDIPSRIIQLYSFKEDTVLDPFLGTGTTMKVAKKLDRNSVGYEINEDYLDLIKDKIGYGNQKLNRKISYDIVNNNGD